MKRTLRAILVSLAMSISAIVAPSIAQAAPIDGVPDPRNGVTCTPRINGIYPEDGHFYYCGDTTLPAAHKDGYGPSLQAIPSAYTKAQLLAQGMNILVFCTEREFEIYFNYPPTFPDADLRQISAFYEPISNQLVIFQYLISRGQNCATPTGNGAANKIAIYNNAYNNMRHEIGHFVDNKISVPASTVKNSQLKTSPGPVTTAYGNYINRDIAFFNDRILRIPCTNSFFTNVARDAFVNAAGNLASVCNGTTLNPELVGKTNFEILQKISPYYFSEYDAPLNNKREQFAETFPISLALLGGQPAGSAANYYLTNHFSCAKAYTKAIANTGALPVKADFDAYISPIDLDPNFRCNSYSAPFVPAGCLFASKTPFNYPYTPGYDQYVYCGDTGLTYTTKAGDVLQNLPNSAGSSFLRDKFQQANFTLYVFKSAADAQAKLGNMNIPAAALAAGVLGFVQTVPVASPTGQVPNKFIAVWERWIPPAGGALAFVETTLAADGTPNRFSAGVSQQAGRVMDFLAGNLSGSPAYGAAYDKDKIAYIAKPTCTVFGSPVCIGGVVQGVYVGLDNFQILTTLHPFLNNKQNLLAEQVPVIVFGNHGTIEPMDVRLGFFHKCTKLYTDKQYNFWRAPTPAELTAATCQ